VRRLTESKEMAISRWAKYNKGSQPEILQQPGADRWGNEKSQHRNLIRNEQTKKFWARREAPGKILQVAVNRSSTLKWEKRTTK